MRLLVCIVGLVSCFIPCQSFAPVLPGTPGPASAQQSRPQATSPWPSLEGEWPGTHSASSRGARALFAQGKARGGAGSVAQGKQRGGGEVKPSGGGGSGRAQGRRPLKGVWRVFNIEVPASEDAGKDSVSVTHELVEAVSTKLGVQGDGIGASALRVVRKSFDARRVRRTGPQQPHFNYVVDVDLGAGGKAVKLKAEPGKFERAAGDERFAANTLANPPQRPVAIVGSGPAGLFAALEFAQAGVPCTVYERGQPVEERGRDIGAMLHRRLLHPESNICYGEGGAGTWSDGKLTTRIGRNRLSKVLV